MENEPPILKDLTEADLYSREIFPVDKSSENVKQISDNLFESASLNDLPQNALDVILQHLNVFELKSMNTVSKRLSTLTLDYYNRQKRTLVDLILKARRLEKHIMTMDDISSYIVDRDSILHVISENGQLPMKNRDNVLQVVYSNVGISILSKDHTIGNFRDITLLSWKNGWKNGNSYISKSPIGPQSYKNLNWSFLKHPSFDHKKMLSQPFCVVISDNKPTFVIYEEIVKFDDIYFLTRNGDLYKYDPRILFFKPYEVTYLTYEFEHQLIGRNIANYTRGNYLVTLDFDGNVEVKEYGKNFYLPIPSVIKDIIHIFIDIILIFAVTQNGQIIKWSYNMDASIFQQKYTLDQKCLLIGGVNLTDDYGQPKQFICGFQNDLVGMVSLLADTQQEITFIPNIFL